jgi:hypothetical protein
LHRMFHKSLAECGYYATNLLIHCRGNRHAF